MKKFYTLILSSLCMMTAVAAPMGKKVVNPIKIQQMSENIEAPTAKKAAKASRDGEIQGVVPFEDIIGEYNLTYYGYLKDATNGWNNLTIELIENEASITPKVYISGFLGNYTIEGVYNEDTGVLSIEDEQYITYMANYKDYVVFRHMTWVAVTDENGNPVYEEDGVTQQTELIYNTAPLEILVNGDELEFNVYDAISVEITGQGWFFLGGQMSATLIPPTVWVPAEGKARFADGWIMSAMNLPEGMTTADIIYDVDIEFGEDNPNLLRIVNPYKQNEYIATYNQDAAAEGYIQFDISDPECVLVKTGVYSGLKMEVSDGLEEYYCNNLAGYLHYYGKWNLEEIKEYASGKYDSDDAKYSWALSTYDTDAKLITISSEDAGYGVKSGASDESHYTYKWVDESGVSPDMTCYIDLSNVNFAGVSDITVDNNSNAPVEYYNLQGVRVSNPTGGLYIRRQGNTATKVLVK